MNGEHMPDDEAPETVENVRAEPVWAEGAKEDPALLKEYTEAHDTAAEESRDPK
jgi:hypothetical protein